MEESPTRVSKWDDEPEDPKTFWNREFREVRERLKINHRVEINHRQRQRAIDSGVVSLSRPFLVWKRN